MLYTDLASGAATEHQHDMMTAAADSRRSHRAGRAGATRRTRGQRHHGGPLTVWRHWLDGGRL